MYRVIRLGTELAANDGVDEISEDHMARAIACVNMHIERAAQTVTPDRSARAARELRRQTRIRRARRIMRNSLDQRR